MKKPKPTFDLQSCSCLFNRVGDLISACFQHDAEELGKPKSEAMRFLDDLADPDKQEGGTKYDLGKPPLELLSPKALEQIALVFGYGAKKYARYNYKKGFDWSRLIGAAYRHLGAFNSGEDLDPETKLSHLAHLACCTIMLLDHVHENLGKDDRWKGNKK